MAIRYGWSLDADDWRAAGRALTGTNWSGTYLEEMYRSGVPEQAGIYMLCSSHKPIEGLQSAKPIFNVLYVGKSDNLRRRFREHQTGSGSSAEVKRCKLAYHRIEFLFTLVPESSIGDSGGWMSDAEQALIDAFGPPANRVAAKARIGKGRPAGSPREGRHR